MADFNRQQIDSMGYEDDQPEFFQVVKKKSSGENTPAVSAAPGQVLEEEEVFEVVKGKKTKTENAGTIRTASAMPMAENVVAPASTAAAAVPAEDMHTRDADGDVELRIKRRVASPLAMTASPEMQKLNRRPALPTESDKLMKPKNYFFGCFSFVIVSAGLIFGSVWFASENWKSIRSGLDQFDKWMVDHKLAKNPDEMPRYEKIQDEIQAELLADNSERLPRTRSAKDAVKHVRNYVQACELTEQL